MSGGPGFTCQTVVVVNGTPQTVSARFYLGCKLIETAAGPASVRIYAGDANTDPLVGAADCIAGYGDQDLPFAPVSLDHGAPGNKMFVEVTGAAATRAIVRFSP